jgi:hypothetical protein
MHRVAMQIALGSEWLPFDALNNIQNGSYTFEFHGPALQCEDANQTWHEQVATVADIGDFNLPWYAAWTPYNASDLDLAPRNLTNYLADIKQNGAGSEEYITLDTLSFPSTQLLLATWAWNNSSPPPMSVYQCSLYNASYTVLFKFTNGITSYSIINKLYLNPVSSGEEVTEDINTDALLWGETVAYTAMMDALGRVLVGWVQGGFEDTFFFDEYATLVLKTPLATTKDFESLYNVQGTQAKVDLGFGPQQSNKSLATAVEELMTNMTLSTFAQSQFM